MREEVKEIGSCTTELVCILHRASSYCRLPEDYGPPEDNWLLKISAWRTARNSVQDHGTSTSD
jgi:hypothetical protein